MVLGIIVLSNVVLFLNPVGPGRLSSFVQPMLKNNNIIIVISGIGNIVIFVFIIISLISDLKKIYKSLIILLLCQLP